MPEFCKSSAKILVPNKTGADRVFEWSGVTNRGQQLAFRSRIVMSATAYPIYGKLCPFAHSTLTRFVTGSIFSPNLAANPSCIVETVAPVSSRHSTWWPSTPTSAVVALPMRLLSAPTSGLDSWVARSFPDLVVAFCTPSSRSLPFHTCSRWEGHGHEEEEHRNTWGLVQ